MKQTAEAKEIFKFLLKHKLIWKDKEYNEDGRLCYRLRKSIGCGLCFYPDSGEFGQHNRFFSTRKEALDHWGNCIRNTISFKKDQIKRTNSEIRELEARLKAGKEADES